MRGQISLLSSDHSPRWLEQLAASYPEAYTIGDGRDPIPGFEHAPLVLPGLGTYQQEASLALIRYWAHVAGVPDSTVAAMSRATGLPEFNRDITNDQP